MDYYEDLKKYVSESDIWPNLYMCDYLDIPRNKAIIIPPYIPYFGEHFAGSIEAVSRYIKEELDAKGWDQYIVFDLRDESYAVGFMKIIDEVIKPLIVNFNFPHQNIFFVNCAADVSFNRKVYYKYCALMNYMPVNVILTNTFESAQAREIFEEQTRELFHSTEPYREKKVLCFNRQPRAHRLVIVSELVNRGLRDSAFISMVKEKEHVLSNLYEINLLYPNMYDRVKQGIEIIAEDCPINLSLTDSNDNLLLPNENDLYLFENSLFSVINETLYHNSVDYVNEFRPDGNINDIPGRIHCYPSTFLTEKTWKTVRSKHPFIMTSIPYTLRGFRELGYKTFHPYIDESYDEIHDDETRLKVIADEIERLFRMTDDETRESQRNVQPKCDHNYQLLRTKKLEFKKMP